MKLSRQQPQEPAKQVEASAVASAVQKAAHALPEAFRAQAQAPSVRGLATMMSVAHGAVAVPDYDQPTVDLGIDMASKYGPETRLYHGTSMDAWGAVGDGLDLYATKNPMEALSYAYDAASRSWMAYMEAHGLESEDEIPSEVRHDRRAIVVSFQVKDVEGLELLGDDASDSLDWASWENSLDAIGSMCIRGDIQSLKPGFAILESGAVEAGEVEPRRRQIDTPEFKDWFGASKVVDKAGNPLVLTHGTPHEFSVFRRGDAGVIWFATKDSAEVEVAILDEGAEQDLPMVPSPDPDAIPSFPIGARVIPVYLKIERPYQHPDNFGYPDGAELRAQGYDGAIDLDPATGEIVCAVVLDPSQIKSALGNRGTFSRTDTNICR